MSQKHTLQEFSTQEAQNLDLAQAGYKIIENVSGGGGTGAKTTGDGEWIGFMVLNGTVTATQTLHEPLGDSPLAAFTSFPVGVLVRGYWKSVIGVRSSGSDAWQMIVYKG